MTTLAHTDPDRVVEVRQSAGPPSGRPVSGYGPRVPTSWEIRYRGADDRPRWHRVYVAQYGNAGSAYVTTGGVDLYLDTDTEHRLEAH